MFSLCTQLLLLLPPLLQVWAGAPAETRCELQASCHPGQLVPNPWDCHHYHLCVKEDDLDPTTQRCPHHHYFDPSTSSCRPEDTPCVPQCPHTCLCQGRLVPDTHTCRHGQLLHVDTGRCLHSSCQNLCSQTSTTPLSVTHHHHVFRDTQCFFSCHGQNSVYADPYICSNYYQCIFGAIIPKFCLDGAPYFNGETCTPDPSSCCAHPTTSTAPNTSTTPNVETTDVKPTLTHTATTPPTTAPHTTAPYTTAPPTTAPHTTAPQTTAPHTTAPHTTAPHTTAPHTTAPHTTAPHTTAPHTTAPHTTTTTKLSTTVSVSTTPQPFGCLFKPDCEGKPLGYLEPDPDNCLKYYFCLGDGSMVSDSLACSQGDYFNPFRHDCEKIVDDSYACLPPCDGICPYSCNDNDRIFDPEDCSSFYFCLQGTYYHMSCPANTPYFNGTQCTPDQGSCCSYPCPPYCPYAGKWVPDGNNCHRFYICLDIGTPTPDTLLTCPDNGVFDYKLGECSSTAKCVTLCDLHH